MILVFEACFGCNFIDMETWPTASPTAMCGANQNYVRKFFDKNLLVKTYPSKNFLSHLGEAVGIIWFWTPVHELALQFPEPPRRALSIIIQMVRNTKAQVQHVFKVSFKIQYNTLNPCQLSAPYIAPITRLRNCLDRSVACVEALACSSFPCGRFVGPGCIPSSQSSAPKAMGLNLVLQSCCIHKGKVFIFKSEQDL